jgi:hypothetical protein
MMVRRRAGSSEQRSKTYHTTHLFIVDVVGLVHVLLAKSQTPFYLIMSHVAS